MLKEIDNKERLKKLADRVRKLGGDYEEIEKLAEEIENFYPIIEADLGWDLDMALNTRNAWHFRGLDIGIYFNEKIIEPDDSIDAAYLKITGMIHEKFIKRLREEEEKRKKEAEEFEKNKPALIQSILNEGYDVLDKKYYDHFARLVPKSVNGIYQGFDIKGALEIVKALKDKKDYEEIDKIFDGQNHSGYSHHIVCLLVKELCDEGLEYIKRFEPNDIFSREKVF